MYQQMRSAKEWYCTMLQSHFALQIHSLIREQHKHRQPINHQIIMDCFSTAWAADALLSSASRFWSRDFSSNIRIWGGGPGTQRLPQTCGRRAHMFLVGTHPQCIIAGPAAAEHDPQRCSEVRARATASLEIH